MLKNVIGTENIVLTAAQDRWTNKNTNGLLRECFPKVKDLSSMASAALKQIAYNLNTKPRKCLDYETNFDVSYSATMHLT